MIRGKAKYVLSKLDGQEYCKTNGKFAKHLLKHGLSEADYVERYINPNSLCPHCKVARMKLDSSTWSWIGSCGAKGQHMERTFRLPKEL